MVGIFITSLFVGKVLALYCRPLPILGQFQKPHVPGWCSKMAAIKLFLLYMHMTIRQGGKVSILPLFSI